jgi:hypothetical protein
MTDQEPDVLSPEIVEKIHDAADLVLSTGVDAHKGALRLLDAAAYAERTLKDLVVYVIRETRRECEKRATVAGDWVDGTIADLARAAEVLIFDEQDKAAPDSRLIGVLCNTVRLTREWSRSAMREKDAEIESLRANYQKIVREVLACNPQSAADRPDDVLEPPWEVVARLRAERDKLKADLATVRGHAREMAAAISAALDVYRNGSYDILPARMAQELEAVDVSDYVGE